MADKGPETEPAFVPNYDKLRRPSGPSGPSFNWIGWFLVAAGVAIVSGILVKAVKKKGY